MNMQSRYDLESALEDKKEVLDKITGYHKAS